ncbi:MAG: hypothetical protein WEE89_04870, partial [Gemmatimonadota bacterium]
MSKAASIRLLSPGSDRRLRFEQPGFFRRWSSTIGTSFSALTCLSSISGLVSLTVSFNHPLARWLSVRGYSS